MTSNSFVHFLYIRDLFACVLKLEPCVHVVGILNLNYYWSMCECARERDKVRELQQVIWLVIWVLACDLAVRQRDKMIVQE